MVERDRRRPGGAVPRRRGDRRRTSASPRRRSRWRRAGTTSSRCTRAGRRCAIIPAGRGTGADHAVPSHQVDDVPSTCRHPPPARSRARRRPNRPSTGAGGRTLNSSPVVGAGRRAPSTTQSSAATHDTPRRSAEGERQRRRAAHDAAGLAQHDGLGCVRHRAQAADGDAGARLGARHVVSVTGRSPASTTGSTACGVHAASTMHPEASTARGASSAHQRRDDRRVPMSLRLARRSPRCRHPMRHGHAARGDADSDVAILPHRPALRLTGGSEDVAPSPGA